MTQCFTCSFLFPSSQMHTLTHAHPHACTPHMHALKLTHVHVHSYSPYKCTITLSCLHTCTPLHVHPYMTPSHMHTLTHTCPHTYPHTSTHTHPHIHVHILTHILTHTHHHTCTPSQRPRVLYAVLFDPLAADFNIDGMWLVMYNGQKRPLSGQRVLQAVGTQINQKISPLD